ncbi:hypothetical protein [Phyllobacterium sp. YR531]|uniref:hypothetical protein n=1 Tax=Phyllobacterium sp. YR531 TaxID=1144343 RepID=UPI00026FBAAE|nr:hypothetical protein [Phyllobacterium sp. YR531]EJN04815.1 hypothetical protein PMI41_01280 [Phyllobacterium sp. YR531]
MSGNQINEIENARFIQQMLGELRAMAKTNNMDMLSYLIEIAYIESSDQLRKQLGVASVSRKRNVTS